ncbi:sensor histidine kinase [Flavimobilis soli]|uniref:sensor histidine kinase n=1 Tax=Flavimobilis soli TaxID=442709 RepID=UPI001FEC715D|nr:HAMP domain-containing sensor histidine kinase [Flavimobilis soli]
MPLRTRMTLITTVVLVVGLTISTVAATTLLERYLLEERDRQLVASAESILQVQDLASLGSNPSLPSDYVVLLQLEGGKRQYVSSGTTASWGAPLIPTLKPGSSVTQGRPFTVPGAVATPRDRASYSDWRVVARDVELRSAFVVQDAVLIVALPVADIHATTAQLWKILSLTCASIAVLGATLGYLAVRRSLRPLRTIEHTARTIADGDMSQRIPPMPQGTEVGAVASSLNTMLGKIEESFDAQVASEARMRRFVSDASHELRTPLVSIRGYAELYRMGAVTTPEHTAESMARIESSAVQMGALVEDLLSLARLDEGRPMSLERLDLREVANGALADLHAMDPTRATAQVALAPDGSDVAPVPAVDGSAAVPPPPVTVVADPARVRQVFTNLMGNIVKHTPEGSAVEVAVGVVDGRAVAEVRDHGPGIPAEHRDLVFERFHRVDPSRNSSSGGSGLGMAIVRDIVTRHGGTVEVRETPGGGATLRLSFPLADDGAKSAGR